MKLINKKIKKDLKWQTDKHEGKAKREKTRKKEKKKKQ